MNKIKLVSGKEVSIGDVVYWVCKKDLTIMWSDILGNLNVAQLEEDSFTSEIFATKEEAEEWVEKYKNYMALEKIYQEGQEIPKTNLEDLRKEYNQSLNEVTLTVNLEDVIKDCNDPVNNPKHYQLFPEHNIEVIDVIDVLVSKSSVLLTIPQCVYYSNLLKYTMRFSEKNGLEDLKKASYYLNRIISQLESK